MAEESELDYEEGNQAEETAVTSTTATGAEDDGLPIYEGVAFGVAAFLVGYVTTFLMTNSQLAASGVELGSDDPASWKMAAWSFLGSQGVGLENGNGDLIGLGSLGTDANAIIFLLPIVLLAAAGYGLVKYTDPDDLQGAVQTSLLVVPGYLVLALVLAFASGFETDTAEAALVTGDAVIYAGVLYPAVFGVIGGLLACWPEPIEKAVNKVQS